VQDSKSSSKFLVDFQLCASIIWRLYRDSHVLPPIARVRQNEEEFGGKDLMRPSEQCLDPARYYGRTQTV
jgi:hypothetical protein